MIDTHTHLYLDEFQAAPSDAVERALEAGVEQMVFPNIDSSTIKPMHRLAALYPGRIFLAMGLHPSEVNEGWEEELRTIEEELTGGYPYVAVGEIGIDLYWDKTFAAQQTEVFRRQCMLARSLGLPVIIHCREALDEVLDVLASLDKVPAGVMHSFGGTSQDVERIRAVAPDFYFGINGIVTFKNSRLRETLPAIGLDKLLLETDSPYLAPVPMRGRRNESAFVVHTAAYIAAAMDKRIEEIDEATSKNARELFHLPETQL